MTRRGHPACGQPVAACCHPGISATFGCRLGSRPFGAGTICWSRLVAPNRESTVAGVTAAVSPTALQRATPAASGSHESLTLPQHAAVSRQRGRRFRPPAQEILARRPALWRKTDSCVASAPPIAAPPCSVTVPASRSADQTCPPCGQASGRCASASCGGVQRIRQAAPASCTSDYCRAFRASAKDRFGRSIGNPDSCAASVP